MILKLLIFVVDAYTRTNDVGTMEIVEPVIADRLMTIKFTPTLYREPYNLSLNYYDQEVEANITLATIFNDSGRRKNFFITALASKALNAKEIFVKYNQERGPSFRIELIGTYLDFYTCLLIMFMLHCHLFMFSLLVNKAC